ncbi:hypothetical protein [Acutalibacter muris]|jgi:hypothetical protein|uniref:hypothetical protein n=1 Tax=Acutalibacter muris TaxID=1796620 RepID=UPI00272E2350|nr:hypothetical protein [Acutalibacter muris]
MLGCMLALTSSINEMGEVVTWPKGIDNQLHFFSVDYIYDYGTCSSNNGKIEVMGYPATNLAIAGVGKLYVPNTANKETILGEYYGSSRYNLFYSPG